MGTRTILVFSEEDNDKLDYGIPIYQHFDGYPSFVLKVLRQYVWVNQKRLDDVSYFSAGFLRYVDRYRASPKIPYDFMMRDEMEGGEKYFLEDPYTGYGLFESDLNSIFNGMEDYYYKITPKRIFVFDHSKQKMAEITIEALLDMPDDEEYFEELEKDIYNDFYGEEW